MTEKFKKTVKIVRPPKVKTDERDRSVSTETVETATLELVSTQMLKKIFETMMKNGRIAYVTLQKAKRACLLTTLRMIALRSSVMMN